jgi:hypothetical protein
MTVSVILMRYHFVIEEQRIKVVKRDPDNLLGYVITMNKDNNKNNRGNKYYFSTPYCNRA